ncbi:hypothetical protein PMZ80_002464 [Knufia obscura]|uniref:Uncharacterized protein n=1 Tax=Knufia obscura TaxID=1635080 RepID=A0ABR0RY89_9EURO|nr:hypothetical protein PMZ80_002464 [Knufia obscura]
MSSGAAAIESVEAGRADFPGIEKGFSDQKPAALVGDAEKRGLSDNASELTAGLNGEIYPTEEEVATLRRVRGKIPWIIYSIGFVELCERFAYYGTTAVFVNFIQQPLPPGSNTGSAGTYGQPGALGMGQRAATGLTLFNNFWSYIMPLMGGYMADTYWGRYKTINVAIGIATLGHVIIIISAIPQVIVNPNGALAAFVIGLIFFGIGVGFFKCNISPMVAENMEARHPRMFVETLKSDERVIVDPTTTISIVYMRYYWMINVGALLGQISMVYAEKYVGFWLSYTLPTILFLFCPVVMIWCKNKYVMRPPTGSVLSKSFKLLGHILKTNWTGNPAALARKLRSDDTWNAVKPTYIEGSRPPWMTWDDIWVDEVRRGLKACTVFVWYPIFWLAYSQMTNNLVSQASTMRLGGVPNDIVHNLNPFALLISIPILDKYVYPAIAKTGFKFTPIKKITMGFACGATSMTIAALIQHFIYVQSPCGDAASGCETPPPLSVWIQTPAYIFIAFSEIFASITGLEYAFTKAPKNMRSLVTGIFWLAQAFSSAVGQAFVPLASDPLLVWLYTIIAILSALGGAGFWFTFRKLDAEEDALNAIPESAYKGRNGGMVDPETKLSDV